MSAWWGLKASLPQIFAKSGLLCQSLGLFLEKNIFGDFFVLLNHLNKETRN